MGGPTTHTGDTQRIKELFAEFPDKEFTALEVAQFFDIPRWKASNAIQHLIRLNFLARGEERGKVRFRAPEEKREEFKVARPVPTATKTEPITYPVLTEFDPGKATPEVAFLVNRQYSTAAQQGRIQFLNATTFIVWNSREQRENIRQMALSH